MSQDQNRTPSGNYHVYQDCQNEPQSQSEDQVLDDPQQSQEQQQAERMQHPAVLALFQQIGAHTNRYQQEMMARYDRLNEQIHANYDRLSQQLHDEYDRLDRQLRFENSRLDRQMQFENNRREQMLMQSFQSLSLELQSPTRPASPPPPYSEDEEEDRLFHTIQDIRSRAFDTLRAPQRPIAMPGDNVIGAFLQYPRTWGAWQRTLPVVEEAQEAHQQYLRNHLQNSGQPQAASQHGSATGTPQQDPGDTSTRFLSFYTAVQRALSAPNDGTSRDQSLQRQHTQQGPLQSRQSIHHADLRPEQRSDPPQTPVRPAHEGVFWGEAFEDESP